jgi:hypothetical protein
MARVSPWTTKSCCALSCSALNGWSNTPSASPEQLGITVQPVRRPPLSARLSDNEWCCWPPSSIARCTRPHTAAEWLLDNYHLVETQIREIREDLPPGFYRQLPKLASGPLLGYPRVFGIAWACAQRQSFRSGTAALWAISGFSRVQLTHGLHPPAHRAGENGTRAPSSAAAAHRPPTTLPTACWGRPATLNPMLDRPAGETSRCPRFHRGAGASDRDCHTGTYRLESRLAAQGTTGPSSTNTSVSASRHRAQHHHCA